MGLHGALAAADKGLEMHAIVYVKSKGHEVRCVAREWLAADESDGRVRNALASINGLVWAAVVLRCAGIG